MKNTVILLLVIMFSFTFIIQSSYCQEKEDIGKAVDILSLYLLEKSIGKTATYSDLEFMKATVKFAIFPETYSQEYKQALENYILPKNVSGIKDIPDKIRNNEYSNFYVKVILNNGKIIKGLINGITRWNGKINSPSIQEIGCYKYRLVNYEDVIDKDRISYGEFIWSKAPRVSYKLTDIKSIKFFGSVEESEFYWCKPYIYIFDRIEIFFRNGMTEDVYIFMWGHGNGGDEFRGLDIFDGNGWVSFRPDIFSEIVFYNLNEIGNLE